MTVKDAKLSGHKVVYSHDTGMIVGIGDDLKSAYADARKKGLSDTAGTSCLDVTVDAIANLADGARITVGDNVKKRMIEEFVCSTAQYRQEKQDGSIAATACKRYGRAYWKLYY